MYAAQISGGDFGAFNPFTAVKKAVVATGKGIATVAKKTASVVVSAAVAGKGVGAAIALCKMPYAQRLTIAKAAGVDTSKLDQICAAAAARNYALLAVLTPDILKLMSKAPASVQNDAAANIPDQFKVGPKKAGLETWQKVLIGVGGLVVVGGAISFLTRPSSRVVVREVRTVAPAVAA
jgi:hypothetical protein